jgi:hypothetical protein
VDALERYIGLVGPHVEIGLDLSISYRTCLPVIEQVRDGPEGRAVSLSRLVGVAVRGERLRGIDEDPADRADQPPSPAIADLDHLDH